MAKGQFPPKFLILRPPGYLWDRAVMTTLYWTARLRHLPWQRMVLGELRGIRWEDGEGGVWMAGRQHAPRHRHGSQGALAQWALFRHLGSEVDAQPCGICVHQDANPDNGAGLQWGTGWSARPLGGRGSPHPAYLALMPEGGSTGISGMGGRGHRPNLSFPLPPQVLPLPPGAKCHWGDLVPFPWSGFGFPGLEREVPLRSDKVLPHPQPPSHLGPGRCYHPHGQHGKRD